MTECPTCFCLTNNPVAHADWHSSGTPIIELDNTPET